MTKTQLTELITARAPHVPQRVLEAMVNNVFELMADALRKGDRIEIRGFGCFAVRTRAARSGRNPKTGVKVSVPPRKTLSFTVGKELRERINAASEQLDPESVLTAGRVSSAAPLDEAASSLRNAEDLLVATVDARSDVTEASMIPTEHLLGTSTEPEQRGPEAH